MNGILPGAARAVFAALIVPIAVAGCSATGDALRSPASFQAHPDAAGHYSTVDSERFSVEAIDVSEVDPQFRRQVVKYPTAHLPGTVVVDPQRRFLYLVEKGGQAIRYGVGVGKAGLAFSGTALIQEKKQWPRWTPTPNMIAREPARYAKWASGVPGGVGNPLGARALYLFRGARDTRYRIHGTTEPQSIGKAVSSGCIRMMNQDVIDLYSRVPLGSKVVVL
jgi:lipoprotein-anchoring transpeptidase ErfK/SrfK